jgi:predicted metal-dependent HD superfamily phosphohydrolase
MLTARRWLELWQRLGAPRHADSALADAFAALTERYAEAQRHYHTAQHIAECLAHFDTARSLCEHEAEVELALWFHDAIYEPRAKDNEAQSAAWALRVMSDAGLDNASCNRVHALIMKTCHEALPGTADEQVLVDIDLAILGADEARFDEYEKQVRAEYGWVPDFLFRRTRKKILEAFLARPALYSTPHFKHQLEKKARENLTRSIVSIQ